jgi:hypothetical protein
MFTKGTIIQSNFKERGVNVNQHCHDDRISDDNSSHDPLDQVS